MEGIKIILLLLCFAPVIYEAFSDRKGETRKDKLIDAALVVAYAVLLSGGAYLVLGNWIAVPLLILMFRVTCFDYIVNAFLKHYSKGHKDINIWKFSGTVALTDKIISKVDWRWRIVIRIFLFLFVLSFFLQ